MHTPNRKIKPFLQVNVGEEAFNYEDEELVGFIKWKGSTDQLKNSKYKHILEETTFDNGVPEGEEEDEHLSDYDWVIIEDNMYGDTLYNYNCDPSGVIIMEEQTSPAKRTQPKLDRYYLNIFLLEAVHSMRARSNIFDDEYFIVYVSNELLLDSNEPISLNEYKSQNIPVAIFTILEQAVAYFNSITLRNGLNSAYITDKQSTIINRKIRTIVTEIQIKQDDQN